MAAQKNTAKKESPKKPVKPAGKPVPSAKGSAKKAAPVKKVAPTKKASPVKKASPAKKVTAPAKKASPAKKVAAPVKKAVATKPTAAPKKPAVPAKQVAPAPKKAIPAKKAAIPKKAAPIKAVRTTPEVKPVQQSKVAPPSAKPLKTEAPVIKPKSSLADFPPVPAPSKPRFVPPKSEISEPTAAAGAANGSHSPAFVQKQKQRLLDLRDELVDSMSGMTRDTIRNAPEGSEASGSGQHQGDAGSDAYDRDFALSVLAKEQDALYEIEQALRRIQAGTYGICEISQKKIPQARLEAIPFARLTVECQAQWEKEYGKRRFRPSNEVGFSGGNYIEEEDSETVSLDEDEE